MHHAEEKIQDGYKGVDLPHRVPVAAEALPSANVRPAVAPQQPGVEHTYHLPESTVGQAKVKRRAPTAAAVTAPPAALGSYHSPPSHWPHLPPQPAAPKTRTRTGESNNCRKCGEHRTAATGHSQYKGHVFCPSFETLTKQQWLANKREEDKKK
ncbi:hypothetical protein SKAU_G00156050 [Synaphobranchus kaupii]|uniref:Uncharacterized protein n=1 Tax=Synaphobranchus kaupii TaxID=118154 RepID=A0A9Q1FHL3_SYNKA|nr:hypothetical protein SKAU_G00156050 [Synaphobranchus kaupii]